MMEKFKMIEGNTCSKCGKAIKAGDAVYAASFDAVRSGVGICEKCAPEKPVAKEPFSEPEVTEQAEAKPVAKEPAPEPAKKAAGKK